MATVNQRFHDALLRRQHQLQWYGNGLSKDVISLLDDTEASLREMLGNRVADISERGFDTGPATTARLRVLQSAVDDMRSPAFGNMSRLWTRELQSLVRAEAQYVDTMINEITPTILDTLLPDLHGVAKTLVTKEPILGNVLNDWVSRMSEGDQQRITRAVQVGLVKGETVDQITRDVLGTRALRGADGAVEITRRDAYNFTRTAVSSLSNQARDRYFGANDDLFQEEQYVATLDSKTTPLCRSLDGNRYKIGEGPIPGRDTHWNCRSVRVPILDGQFLGDRPAAAWTEDELAGLSQRDRRARIRELTGTVPASTTYQDWLMDQSEGFQDSVLGPRRADLFRAGKVNLRSMVDTNTGRQWSLKDLEANMAQTWE